MPRRCGKLLLGSSSAITSPRIGRRVSRARSLHRRYARADILTAVRGVVLLCLSACGRLGFDSNPPSDTASDAPIDWTLWSSPVHVDSAGTTQFDWEPAIHPNNKVLVFTRADDTVSTSDLFVTTRASTGGEFGTATMLPFSQGGDFGPAWTPDGTQLYFT